jgi:hypothetical protein
LNAGEKYMSPSPNDGKSPLDAAKKIVEELNGMTPDHQALALRFALETMGLKAFPAQSPPITNSTAPAASPQQTPTHVSGADHSADIRSFTAMKSPKSDRQFTAVVAYFYQFEARPDDRRDSINGEIMKEAARLAGWPQVARWSMTLTNAKNAGYLDAAGGGNFKLSSVGENLVAITLPGDGAPTRAKSTVANKAKSLKKGGKKKKG